MVTLTAYMYVSFTDSRREKSLGLLTQNFVRLFVCSNVSEILRLVILLKLSITCYASVTLYRVSLQVDMITLDEVAKLLLGDAHNTSVMRSKRILNLLFYLKSL